MPLPQYEEWFRNNPEYEEVNGVAVLRSQNGVMPAWGSGIAGPINRFMTDQARMPFEANLPDYGSMVAQRSTNTGSLLRGEVPADVTRQIMQAGAERGIATGSPGSPNANAAWLQALGLTSLGLQQQGSQNLSQSIADTPVPQLFNPASLFVPQTLAAQELAAAQAGLSSGGGSARGGGGGGYITGMPNLGVNTGAPLIPSWERSGGPAVGRTGYHDDSGLFNSSSFSGGMWTGQGGNQYYNLPTGNTYGGGPTNVSNFNDPYDPGYWASDVPTVTPGSSSFWDDWDNAG